MIRPALLLLVPLLPSLGACTATSDNLGNHVFADPRWSISLGGTGDEHPTAIAVDARGDVLVAGTCRTPHSLTAHVRCNHAFLTQRATDTGREQWTVLLHNAEISSIGVDDAGDIVATGTYRGTADIAGTSITASGADEFFALFDSSGALVSLGSLGIQGTAVAPRATVAGDGDVFVTGGFQGLMPTPDGWMLDSRFGIDGYLSLHYPDGWQQWDLSFRGAGDTLGTAIAITHDNRVAMLVHEGTTFSGDIGVPRIAPTTKLVLYTPSGQQVSSQLAPADLGLLATASTGELLLAGDGLVALDGEGTLLWHRAPDETGTIDALATLHDGTIVTASSLVLRAFTHDGAPAGIRPAPLVPPSADAGITALAAEPTGEVAFVGASDQPIDFGNGTLPIAGAHDVIVVKLDSPTGLDWSGDLTRY